MERGIVKFYNTLKGYGFIFNETDGRDYFFGGNDCVIPVFKGDKVTFEVGNSKKGPVAKTVQPL
jgi:cold shock protein